MDPCVKFYLFNYLTPLTTSIKYKPKNLSTLTLGCFSEIFPTPHVKIYKKNLKLANKK